MQYPTAKKSLKQQARPVIQTKILKNHDRILYVNGLFTPPKSEERPVVSAKETEEWRSLFTMVLITGFGAIMLVISVMLENNNVNTGKSFQDGVITSRKTFQKYFTPQELKQFVDEHLKEEAIAVAPGVYFVFKDKVIQQQYLLSRSRSSSSVNRVNLKLAPRLTPEERDQAKFIEYKDLLDPLWLQWLNLGREPVASELQNLNELKNAFGSLARALRFLRSYKDDSILQVVQKAKREDLLIFLALELFKQRTAFREMPPSFQRDIKVFFGSITEARKEAHDLLFQISNAEEINKNCEQAASEGLGHLSPKQSLQIHTNHET